MCERERDTQRGEGGTKIYIRKIMSKIIVASAEGSVKGSVCSQPGCSCCCCSVTASPTRSSDRFVSTESGSADFVTNVTSAL